MSSGKYGVVMDDEEVATFLETQGIGTLSLGDERGGYGVPMSFGYDRTRERCILQLSFGEDSEKATYIDSGNQVSLSTYEWNAVDDWQSVVVRGTLHELSSAKEPWVAGLFAAYSKIASREIFQQPLEELEFEWYELRIDDVHGRAAVD